MDIKKIGNKISQNIELKIISFILAIILWFYAIGQQKSEIIFNIPLEIKTKENMIAFNQSTEFVTITLRGQQNVIKGISKSQFKITVNLNESTPGIINYRLSPKNVSIPEEIEIIDIEPEQFTAKIDYIDFKIVPVNIIQEGKVPAGYFIEKISAEPEMVRIEGVKSKIEKISFIETFPLITKGAKQNFTNIVKLQRLEEGIFIKGNNEIKVTVVISREEIIPKLEIKVINYEPFQVNVTPQYIQAIIYGENHALELLNKKTITASINVKGMKKGEYILHDVALSLPDGVKLKKIIPEEVKVIIN